MNIKAYLHAINLDRNVHRSIIHNSQELETNWIAIKGWRNIKENLLLHATTEMNTKNILLS